MAFVTSRRDASEGRERHEFTLSRRRFLYSVGAAVGTLALGCGRGSTDPFGQLPMPDQSGIDHIVVLVMENRSFDHFLGWLPGADGRQAGLQFTDVLGVRHGTYHLAQFNGCGHPDPDHSYNAERIDFNGGACDGWLRAGPNDPMAIGYFDSADLPFSGTAHRDWTTFDRYFSPIMGPSNPNRICLLTGQTDRLDDSHRLSSLPTIFDRLSAAGLRARYYGGGAAWWGAKYNSIQHPVTQFASDCATGDLPEVAFLGSPSGADDHPPRDVRNGEANLNAVYTAVTTSPAWARTVLLLTFDECGGFFDHVPPPVGPIPPAEVAVGNDGRLGFRVPCLMVSPLARRGYISHTTYTHASILRMICWRWGLEALTVRDAQANNLAQELVFGAPRLTAPVYTVPPGPFALPTPCSSR